MDKLRANFLGQQRFFELNDNQSGYYNTSSFTESQKN